MEDLKEINEEISKIRDKIYSSFSNIDFYEDKHEYFVNEKKTNQRVQYSSVSSVIHKYEQPFDKELVAERYALKHGLNKEDVLSEWKYSNLCSTISGTRVHLYGEGYTWLTCGIFDKIPNEVKPQFVQPENWLVPTSPKENGVKKFYDELHPTLIPIGAEFMLSSENLNIKTKMCGTTDLLFYFNHPTDKSKNGVVLSDWKTNKDLKKEYARTNNIMMKIPFDYLVDEPLSHYTLQFGCYQLMLESIGINIIGRRLIWIKDNDYELFKISDVTPILKSIL